MDLVNPLADVVPSAHGPVLAVLASATTPLTGRAIAGLTHPRVSQPRVARILHDLADAGLATRVPAGSASLFSLNREHVAAGAVEALASLRDRLWERIATHVDGWNHEPDAVVVHGAAAGGAGDARGDVRLLVVRPSALDEDDEDWRRDLADLADRVARWTGNRCAVLERSADELRTMAAAGEQLLTEIGRDGRAVVGAISLVPTSGRAGVAGQQGERREDSSHHSDVPVKIM
ncbi:hypothetical protein [Cellulomonas sp. S1-8]|uniref:hypothetical protein n=1 Tax=Cellulomonas sp. S1-8 TaxID=2904790 RepID=UPI002243AA6A|nr:hypothetical protein [Cellulomonas sp. S1-8]UZN03543.1 hypothetical protein OKX07_00940 [Cellulomonas sp. S1-8]